MISSDLFQYYSHGGVAPGLQSICVNRQITGYYSAEAAYSEGPKTDAFLLDEVMPDPLRYCGTTFWATPSMSAARSSGLPRNDNSQPLYSFTPAPPCCGQCAVYPSRAQLLYWPTPNPSQHITALTGSSGRIL